MSSQIHRILSVLLIIRDRQEFEDYYIERDIKISNIFIVESCCIDLILAIV